MFFHFLFFLGGVIKNNRVRVRVWDWESRLKFSRGVFFISRFETSFEPRVLLDFGYRYPSVGVWIENPRQQFAHFLWEPARASVFGLHYLPVHLHKVRAMKREMASKQNEQNHPTRPNVSLLTIEQVFQFQIAVINTSAVAEINSVNQLLKVLPCNVLPKPPFGDLVEKLTAFYKLQHEENLRLGGHYLVELHDVGMFDQSHDRYLPLSLIDHEIFGLCSTITKNVKFQPNRKHKLVQLVREQKPCFQLYGQTNSSNLLR
nr:hypothetical protein KK1_020016 [Ipomoea batatas]